MLKARINILFFVTLLGLIGCDSNKYFEEYKPIENSTWPTKKQLAFSVESADTQASYDLFLLVRNTKKYKYQNLYVFLDIVSPSGKIERDTLECILADVNGKWFGSTAGDLVDNKIWFKTDFRFQELGTYKFLFEQAMREDNLEEIKDFGLRIEKK